jgi:hypothetical protein
MLVLDQVSNANGYLCHIRLESVFRCDPNYLFSIFTNPGRRPSSLGYESTGREFV